MYVYHMLMHDVYVIIDQNNNETRTNVCLSFS